MALEELKLFIIFFFGLKKFSMFYIEHKMRLNIFPVNFLLEKKVNLHTIELRIEKNKYEIKNWCLLFMTYMYVS